MKFRESWYEERQSAYLYRVLATKESGTPREKLFLELARMAEEQAKTWVAASQKEEPGTVAPAFHPALRAGVVALLIRVFGPRMIKPVLAGMKIRGISVYSCPQSLAEGHAIPTSADEVGDRHKIKGSSGSIRAAVFGINDGLVSTASLIIGVAAAASFDANVVVMSGVAGLLAGALSMAAGEYISVRSQRELLEYQLALEQAELEMYPEEEALELALIYEARGIPKDRALETARMLVANPKRALETLAREELGLDPSDLGSPWGAALSSFFSFAFGGAIPLLPFLFSKTIAMLPYSMGLTGFMLFVTGAVVSLFSGRGVLLSGFRMLLIGGGAGAISYLIGSWIA